MRYKMIFLKIVNALINEFTEYFEIILMNLPGQLGRFLRRKIFTYLIGCDSNLSLETGVLIKGINNISIGKNCSITRNSSIYARNAVLKIGDNFALNSNSIIGADNGEIYIGNDVIIAQNVILRAADHRHESIDIPIRCQGHVSGKISIKDGVWIGANSVITKDVIIGKESIVAAGSVVTKDVPPNVIVGGVPAKIIRERINSSIDTK